MAASQIQRGMFYMAIYTVLQSLVWGIVRYVGDDLSTATLFFFRNLIGFCTIIPLFMKQGPALFKTDKLRFHLLRAAFAFIGGFSVFFAVAHAPLASVVAMTYAAPVFAGVFAMVVFKEGVTLRRIVALGIGFIGVLIVLKPSFEMEVAGMIAAIIATITTAGAFLVVKKLSGTERSETVVAYPFVLILPFSALYAVTDWTSPTGIEWLLVLFIGLGTAISQFYMVKAFAAADASAVLPIDFLRLVVAAILGIALFGDVFDVQVVLGAAVILSVTVYTARREKRAERLKAELLAAKTAAE
ncbi:DMT family transporter [Kordiimonas pumila]|uniref:DMT family transporter n=1 Tax=Kordiimonas pumila TaxID=2161677 RepID=A0ABV7D4G8_9PROT|nr:DMT family transporter [Kordiimonas pumila]